MLGYESEVAGDGLTGHYFDNEVFQGNFIKRVDDNINL
jgi:hypothetical protein